MVAWDMVIIKTHGAGSALCLLPPAKNEQVNQHTPLGVGVEDRLWLWRSMSYDHPSAK